MCKIEIGGADCVGVATTKRVRMEHGMHAGSSSIYSGLQHSCNVSQQSTVRMRLVDDTVLLP